MNVYSLYILNKAGGLIYQTDFQKGVNKLTANDYLVLAGTLHGVHAITSRFTTSMGHEGSNMSNSAVTSSGKALNPNTNRSGLQSIETDFFNLYVFQSLTGIKFIIVTSPVTTQNLSKGQLQGQLEMTNQLFRNLYVIYSDYVMKDPFYSLEMPIKNSLFDLKINELIN